MINEILDSPITNEKKISTYMRMQSMFFDYLFMCTTIPFIFGIPMTIIVAISSIGFENYYMHNAFMIFVLAYMMSKDIINGKSFGKNRKKMHIVDINTNTPASGIKTILRNTTVIIWPIEVIIVCINPERRLGDFITGTKLSSSDDSENFEPLAKLNKTQIAKDYAFAVVISAFINGLAFFIFEL